jgi:hypothetical protein
VQGAPLREGTLHAAIVTRDVRDASGARLGVPEATRRLIEGREVPGLEGGARGAFDVALDGLRELGVDLDEVAGVTAFRTWRPSAELERFVAAARAEPVTLGPFEPREVFADFCVFEARATLPDYQTGEPPYQEEGGGWGRGPGGAPASPRPVESRLVLTLPRAPAPPGGFPVSLFIRTEGGGDRPLVDRGPRAEPGGPALRAGTGPALELARAGFAGLSWDGPHGGLRNVTGGDEQFLVFNFLNPEALRDNLRQTALEAARLVDAVDTVVVTATTCPGLGSPARLDADTVALMGHSMGGTVAPLAAAVEPRFSAVVLSGAGGSWIENVIHKESPLAVRPLAELLLGYADAGRRLVAHDPALGRRQVAIARRLQRR